MNQDRTTIFPFNAVLEIFNDFGGYYNLSNSDLSNELENLNLLDSNNREKKETVEKYQRWALTASFLQLLNAWQWFFSGVLLSRQACLPAQTMQMYYYSIFFAQGSFLSAQFKGQYTLKTQIENETGKISKTRKEVWLGEKSGGGENIKIAENRRDGGGEHATRANWFYEVLKNWNFKDLYPDVLDFDSHRGFHSERRNASTYALYSIVEELYGIPEEMSEPSNGILISLWNRESDLGDSYPEELWALEHIKVATDLHIKLLQGYKQNSPYGKQQVLLIENLFDHHKRTGLVEVLKAAMPDITAFLNL